MSKNQIGCQTISCSVTSCRYNDQGTYCEKSRIQVEPCKHRHEHGSKEDESLCESYEAK